MPEGQSLCLLKLAPRILIQIFCLFTSYILVRVNTYGNNVKRMVGWVPIPDCYNSLLFQGVSLLNMFSHSVGSLFILSMVSFAVQKLFSLM